jgi:hypothetical protein
MRHVEFLRCHIVCIVSPPERNCILVGRAACVRILLWRSNSYKILIILVRERERTWLDFLGRCLLQKKNAASLQLFVYSSGARAHSAASYFDVAFIKKFHETPGKRAQKLVLFWRESLEWNRLCLKATSQFIFFAGRNFRRTHLPSRIARHVFRKIILLEDGRLEQNENDRTHSHAHIRLCVSIFIGSEWNVLNMILNYK